MFLHNYFNHAHNDYLQWWMEAGWLGAALLVASLGVLAFAGARAFAHGTHSRFPAAAAAFALAALLLHSWVDYPLRTGRLRSSRRSSPESSCPGALGFRGGGQAVIIGEVEGERHTA